MQPSFYALPPCLLFSYKFTSDTDTELFAHLVADVRSKHPSMPLDAVVRCALAPVTGAFGVCFVFSDRPDLLIGARHGSPLLLGVGEGEHLGYLAPRVWVK